MGTGQTYIEINYDSAWVQESIAKIEGFSWLFEWGMFLFLIATIAVLFWIFFDSITKHKDRQALVPRILTMVGMFMIIPAFIFRFTGNADGVTRLVRLGGEAGSPYYPDPINWNVNWLVAGYGPIIAVLALVGVVLSVAGLAIYASSVQRAKPSTEFLNAFDSQMSSLESKVENISRAQQSSHTASVPSVAPDSPSKASTATIIDRKPQAATIIDLPRTRDILTVRLGSGRANTYDLPDGDVVIGRDPSCFITVGDGKVSSKHLRLSHTQGSWVVVDLGSTNGSYCNGQKLTGQLRLANGDLIRIGDTTLEFAARAMPVPYDSFVKSIDEVETPFGSAKSPTPVELDKVRFSVVSPSAVERDEYATIDMFMYEQEFRDVVDQLKEESFTQVQERQSGFLAMRENSTVRVVLSSQAISVEDGEQEQTWLGGFLSFSFDVLVPYDYVRNTIPFAALVYVDGIMATRLKFVVRCAGEGRQQPEIVRHDIHSAFVSYASADRDRVVALIQGMRAARPDLEIFFDVQSLRVGDDWEHTIMREVESRDVLYLCWSRSARASKYVDLEWRHALETKGIDYIEPVPIEPPSVCPPPEELRAKHFNDVLLYLLNKPSLPWQSGDEDWEDAWDD